MQKPIKTIKIPATKDSIIANATDIFYYIDSDFKNWNLTEASKPTKETVLDVYELNEDKTFKEIFTNPEEMCLTQAQILEFINNIDRNDFENTHFFLFKSKDDFFVAYVYVYSDRLRVRVIRLEYDSVWSAGISYRFVVPQLTPGDLDNKLLDTSALCPHCGKEIKLSK